VSSKSVEPYSAARHYSVFQRYILSHSITKMKVPDCHCGGFYGFPRCIPSRFRAGTNDLLNNTHILLIAVSLSYRLYVVQSTDKRRVQTNTREYLGWVASSKVACSLILNRKDCRVNDVSLIKSGKWGLQEEAGRVELPTFLNAENRCQVSSGINHRWYNTSVQ